MNTIIIAFLAIIILIILYICVKIKIDFERKEKDMKYLLEISKLIIIEENRKKNNP